MLTVIENFNCTLVFINYNFLNIPVVDENTDKLAWILDITVAYSEGKPLDLPTIIMGQRRACRTHMYYRLFPSSIVRQMSILEICILKYCIA